MEKDAEKNRAIIAELRSMVEADQAMRSQSHDDLSEENIAVDRRNTEQLKSIIDEIGWPSITNVGNEGSRNAWLLAQHADHDPEFQKKCLALIKAEPEGQVQKSNIAYLEDRIAVSDGNPQIYGTQFSMNSDGQLEPLPILNPKNVDKRRRKMRLETLSAYQQRIRKMYEKSDV